MTKLILFVFALPVCAMPTTYNLEAQLAHIGFLAIGRPSALRIRGETKSLKGSAEIDGQKLSVTADCPLNTFETGIELRDKHMKEKYLETGKFPTANLKTLAADLSSNTFRGTLSLHGVEKEVSGSVREEKMDGKASLRFEFPINTSDFKIETPKFMGITMGEKVDVSVDVTLENGKPKG